MSVVRLCGCAGSSEPRWPHVREETSHELTGLVKHDSEPCKNQFTSFSLCVCAYV